MSNVQSMQGIAMVNCACIHMHVYTCSLVVVECFQHNNPTWLVTVCSVVGGPSHMQDTDAYMLSITCIYTNLAIEH